MWRRPVGRMPLRTRFLCEESVTRIVTPCFQSNSVQFTDAGTLPSCGPRGFRSTATLRCAVLKTARPPLLQLRLQNQHSEESLCYLPGQQIARDDHALNFAGAFVNGDDASVAIHAFDVRFARIALAAVNLNCFVSHAIYHFSGIQFCARGERAKSRRTRVAHPCGVMHKCSRGFNFRLHVSEHPLYSLEVANGFSKCAALLGIGYRSLQRSLRDADCLRRDAHATAIQKFQGNLQALAFFAQAILFWDFAIGKGDFRRARSAQPHLIPVSYTHLTLPTIYSV